MHRGKPTVLGVASGAVAGLATVTPASGFIGPLSALAIGWAAGAACYAAIVWKGRMGYDDSLDVEDPRRRRHRRYLDDGLFASKAINPAGADGLFFGSAGQFGVQALTVVCVALFSLIGTWILLKFVDGVIGLWVSPEDEATGLDLSRHNERAYS